MHKMSLEKASSSSIGVLICNRTVFWVSSRRIRRRRIAEYATWGLLKNLHKKLFSNILHGFSKLSHMYVRCARHVLVQQKFTALGILHVWMPYAASSVSNKDSHYKLVWCTESVRWSSPPLSYGTIFRISRTFGRVKHSSQKGYFLPSWKIRYTISKLNQCIEQLQ